MTQRVGLRWPRIDRLDAGQRGHQVFEFGDPPAQLIEFSAHVLIHTDDGRSIRVGEPRLQCETEVE